MRKKTLLVVIILLGIIRVPLFSQTTQGTDFYLSFGKNSNQSASAVNLQIRIAATKATTVTYTYGNGFSYSENIAIGVTTRNLASENAYVYSNTAGVSSNSLRIQSTQPISVYALNQYNVTADATNVLPVSSLGTEYFHISYIPVTTNAGVLFEDGYTIIATEDGTDIFENNVKLNATPLNSGKVFSVYRREDMTGAYITSTKPIALFTTNVNAAVPVDFGNTDNLFQQIPQVRHWGKKYIVPVTRRGVERVRIVAARDNTTVTQTGGTIITGSLSLNKGQFVELEISLAAGGCYISADKPVGVCSFLVGKTYPSLIPTATDGDPAIAWAPPVEQFVDSAVIAAFVPNNNTNLKDHFALVVTNTDTRDQTTLNIGGMPGNINSGTWTTGASGYSFLHIQLTDNNNAHTFANPSGLAVMGYGVGDYESYYYLAASALKDLSAAFYVNGESYLDVNGKKFCDVSSFHIKSVLDYQNPDPGSLEWYIDGVQRSDLTDLSEWYLTGLQPGSHTIKMRASDLNNVFYSYETTILTCSPRIPVNHN
jgi:hypothetical protein